MKNKPICIIGGMGPQASNELYRLLIEKSISQYGAKADQDFPEILIYSLAAPDIISNGTNFGKTVDLLRSIIQKVQVFEPGSISIACNTAHLFVKDLKSKLGNEFVSLIETVIDSVKDKNLSKVGVIATPVTLDTGLYQRELIRAGIIPITPDVNQRKMIDGVIRAVLAGKVKKSDIRTLKKTAELLKNKGAEGIILGCTELPLVFPKRFNVPVFNSLEILADRLLKDYFNNIN